MISVSYNFWSYRLFGSYNFMNTESLCSQLAGIKTSCFGIFLMVKSVVDI